MIVYGLQQDGEYVGFGYCEMIEEAMVYDPQIITVVELGSAEENVARQIVDWMTMKGQTPINSIDPEQYVLTQVGQSLFDQYSS